MGDVGSEGGGKAVKTRQIFRAVLPESLQGIYDISGAAALLIFVFGFITAGAIAAGLFYSGRIPLSLVPEEYRRPVQPNGSDSPQQAGVRGNPPTSIEVHVVKEIPDWVSPIKNWLESEAGKRQAVNLINGSMTDVVETQELPATNEFKWGLKTSSADYKLVGWAFKVTGSGPSESVVPLSRKKPGDDRDSILFEVPKCEKGDRLMAVVRISWERKLTPVDFLSTFRSTVE
jgi:hypothetical protein